MPIGNKRMGFPLQQIIPSFFSPTPITVLGTSFQTPTNSPRPRRDTNTTPDTSFGSLPDTGTVIKVPQNNTASCDVLSSMRLPYSFSLPDVRDSLRKLPPNN